MTDSELVPWGKGEKNPDKGSEIDLKPCVYKQSEPTGDGVPIEEWANELIYVAWLSNSVAEP